MKHLFVFRSAESKVRCATQQNELCDAAPRCSIGAASKSSARKVAEVVLKVREKEIERERGALNWQHLTVKTDLKDAYLAKRLSQTVHTACWPAEFLEAKSERDT